MLTFPRTLRRPLHWAAMTAACAALSCGAGGAAEPVDLAFHEKDGHYDIQGSFQVEAPARTAWEVLSDYDHIPRFVHNLKLSRIQIREGNDVLLRQEAEGGFLFFTQKVRLFLYIQETPVKTIVFKDIAHKDFKSYEGSWTLEEDPAGPLKVTYRLQADLNFDVPAFLASDAMKGGARDLLDSVRKEILQRRKAPAPATPETQAQAPRPAAP